MSLVGKSNPKTQKGMLGVGVGVAGKVGRVASLAKKLGPVLGAGTTGAFIASSFKDAFGSDYDAETLEKITPARRYAKVKEAISEPFNASMILGGISAAAKALPGTVGVVASGVAGAGSLLSFARMGKQSWDASNEQANLINKAGREKEVMVKAARRQREGQMLDDLRWNNEERMESRKLGVHKLKPLESERSSGYLSGDTIREYATAPQEMTIDDYISIREKALKKRLRGK